MYFEIAVTRKFPSVPCPNVLSFQWKCLVSGVHISSQKEEVFRESSMGKFDSVPPSKDGFFDFVSLHLKIFFFLLQGSQLYSAMS